MFGLGTQKWAEDQLPIPPSPLPQWPNKAIVIAHEFVYVTVLLDRGHNSEFACLFFKIITNTQTNPAEFSMTHKKQSQSCIVAKPLCIYI